MEPVRAHGFVPVARHLVDAAAVGGAAGSDVRAVAVDRVVPGQDDRPVVIVELAGKEKRAREAVVLRAVVAVMLMGGDGIDPEAAVVGCFGWQLIVVAEENGL